MQQLLFVLLCLYLNFSDCLGQGQDVPTNSETIKAYTEIREETVLQSLIEMKDFDGALQRLQDFPEEASFLVVIKNHDTIVARHMALHAAFLVDIPVHLNDAKSQGSMLQPQVDLIHALVKINPLACSQKDLKKRNPLQLAVASPKITPTALIELLIEAYPAGIKARDAEDRLPLHSAVAYPMTSFENVQAVIKAYPEAVDVQDEDESLPIHIAAWGGDTPQALPVIKLLHEQRPSNLDITDGDSETVLSLMAKYGRTTVEALQYILDLDPKALARHRDEMEGNAMLHFAVQSSRLNKNTIYLPVLKSYPEAAKQINRVGKLPLHMALRDCCSSPEAIQALLSAYPQAAKSLDGDGMLPLHHACLVGVSETSIVTNLIETYPASVQFPVIPRDEKDKVYPIHLAMRHTVESGRAFNTQNEIIYLVLEKYPDAAKLRDAHVGLYPFHLALLTRRPVNILKKLMALTPDAVSEIIHIYDKKTEKTTATTALHVFASVGPTYLKPTEIVDMVGAFLSYYRDCAKQEDGNGRLPLHEVWSTVTDYDVDSRNAMVNALLEINPEGTHVFDTDMKSPLSYAVFQRDYFGVQKVLPLYPEAAHKKAHDGSLPLHQLCDLGARGVHTEKIEKIMDLLLQANPQAAFEVDNMGNLPLHKLAESTGFDRINKATIQKVIDANPEGTNATNADNRQPLMITIMSSTSSESEAHPEYWIGMIDALLQINPQSARRHAVGGKTAFAKILFDIDSLHPNRRKEDDPLLQILKMLYKCHPQAVLELDRRDRNALHNIATLLGDMGGLTPDSWKDFAIQIMHDFPELGIGIDNSNRTALFLYTLYLGDTAIATREKQDSRTTVYIETIGELLNEFIALNPDALGMADEYGLTPFAQITSNRMTVVRGSIRYNRSPIIKVMKRLLSRDASFWYLLSRFKAPLHAFKKHSQEQQDCVSLKSIIYEKLREDLDATLEKFEVEVDEPIDSLSCKEEWHEVCQHCPELSQVLATIDRDLSSLEEKLDANYGNMAEQEKKEDTNEQH
jgi:ankyrin repeat protein